MIRKRFSFMASTALACAFAVTSPVAGAASSQSAELQSIGPIAFSPTGLLLVADPKAAAVLAIEVDDTTVAHQASLEKLSNIDAKIAEALGTTADDILINDLAINPVSKNAYLSVSRGRGPDSIPVVVRVGSGERIEIVDLSGLSFTNATLPNPPEDAFMGEGRRRRNPRMSSITDIAWVDGAVVVAGLSNEEFASTLRTIPYPFAEAGVGTGVEVYHGAHGRFETHAPIRTFVPYELQGETNILAAYTCTPLVRIPVSKLKSGENVRGTTIAEMGAGNRPLDMIVYQHDDHDYFLMANSNRGVMKIDSEGLETYGAITARVSDKEGVPYETVVEWDGVMQLALLDDHHAAVVTKNESGAHDLVALALP